jgi:hypothetical protein
MADFMADFCQFPISLNSDEPSPNGQAKINTESVGKWHLSL